MRGDYQRTLLIPKIEAHIVQRKPPEAEQTLDALAAFHAGIQCELEITQSSWRITIIRQRMGVCECSAWRLMSCL